MIAYFPSVGDILGAARTTTGTILTIPAGRTASVNIQIAGSASAAGLAAPVVTLAGGGTGAEPAASTALARLSMNGLALTTVTDSCSQEVMVRAGDADATLEFSTGGASSASVTVSGFLI